jgi:tRNA-splicing ligase RtcB
VSAKRGEMGIIPGSMGARSYIVRGLGNPRALKAAATARAA